MIFNRTALWLFIAGVFFSGIGSCATQSPPPDPSGFEETGVLGSLLSEPEKFESQTLTITGKFYGWRGPCTGVPPISRNDWMIADETHCLYVHGPVPPGMDSSKPALQEITITGVVRLKKGQPYLDTTAGQKQ